MHTRRPLFGLMTVAMLAAPLWLWAACGDDGDLVGNPCRDDRDCDADARCFKGGDFPDGQCSVYCRDSRDCPSDSVCVDKNGGYCAWICRDDRDCRPGYACKFEDERGAPDKSRVCRKG